MWDQKITVAQCWKEERNFYPHLNSKKSTQATTPSHLRAKWRKLVSSQRSGCQETFQVHFLPKVHYLKEGKAAVEIVHGHVPLLKAIEPPEEKP